MDPEELLPMSLIVLAVLGVAGRVGRRARGAGENAASPTPGQNVGAVGATLSRGTASALRAGGRLGVDLTSGALRTVGTVASAVGGVMLDGAALSIGTLSRPVLRGAGHTVNGAAALVFPRGGDADSGPSPAIEGGSTEVLATPRGKRFHRASCPMRSAGGLTMERDTAVETGRQPCPTCRP
ncbi:MAG: hypothetical protein ACYDAD_12170 [Acidimicrobiales bacterium]